jgi:hypothetical protein
MNHRPYITILIIATMLVQGRVYSQEARMIKGEILSEENSPVPGLAVIQLGTNNAVVTDLNGKFELTVENQGDVFVHLFGLDLEIYLKFEEGENAKTIHLNDWKQLKKSNRKISNEWMARNHR